MRSGDASCDKHCHPGIPEADYSGNGAKGADTDAVHALEFARRSVFKSAHACALGEKRETCECEISVKHLCYSGRIDSITYPMGDNLLDFQYDRSAGAGCSLPRSMLRSVPRSRLPDRKSYAPLLNFPKCKALCNLVKRDPHT